MAADDASPAVARAALERAITDEETLVLFYQPIHELESRRIVAAEALLRQRRESGEIREAGVITAAAEDASPRDLFCLDSLMMDRAYRDASGWVQDVRLNVNLSPREFQEGNVIERLTELITRCGMDPQRLNLEITETSFIEDPRETMDVLVELRQLGIQLWLDDFGTGHSSLEHLQRFPIDGIKLPATFVKDVVHDPRCRAIVTMLIRLAHELHMAVIAEGVEHDEQLSLLRDERCDYVQGFLYSRPMAVEKLEKLLAE